MFLDEAVEFCNTRRVSCLTKPFIANEAAEPRGEAGEAAES